MTRKAEDILQEALTMSPEERSMMAHHLISSLDEIHETAVEKEWIAVANERLKEIQDGKVTTVTWNEIKNVIK